MSAPTPNDPVAEYLAVTQRAMVDIQRARTQSGVSATDELNPLIEAIARSVGVLGRLPEALRTMHVDARTAAEATTEQAVADTIRSLVEQSGAAAARGYQAKWVAICVGTVAVALVSVGWWSYEQGRRDGVTATEWRAEAFVNDVKAGLPALNAWASSMVVPARREQAAWAARLSPADFEAAQWGVSPDGKLAQRFQEKNIGNGGLRAIAGCNGKDAERDKQDGGIACLKTVPFWPVE